MNKRTEIERLLQSHTHLFIGRLNAELVDMLTHEFITWESAVEQDEIWQTPRPERLIRFLLFTIEEEVQKVFHLRARYTEFHKRFSGAATNPERREHILDFAKELGAGPSRLKKDEKAFNRWFGADAVTDRFRKQVALKEMKIGFSLDRLSAVAVDVISAIVDSPDYQKLISRLRIEKTIMQLLEYDGDNRVRISAFQCLAGILKLIPSEFQKKSITENTLKYVFQAALDHRQHIWIQCEALQLLESISLKTLQTSLEKRLSFPTEGDDLFVRSRAVKILARNLKQLPALRELLPVIAKDPSPYVRKTMVRTLESIDQVSLCYWMSRLAVEDNSPQVRASALLNIIHLLDRTTLFAYFRDLLVQSLKKETDPFTLRVGLKVAGDCTLKLIKNQQYDLAEEWFFHLHEHLQHLHLNAENLSVRRWASQTHEQMWVAVDQDARQLQEQLLPLVKSLKPGKKVRLPKHLLTSHDPAYVCRVLSVINQDNFPLEIKTSVFGDFLIKNHCFNIRLWRTIHEFRNPAPDKRQAFPHTTGRFFSGHLHIPSSIMSELTYTKVPGEPVFMSQESGWRPYLPLVDEILSLLDHSIFKRQTIRIFTHEGITNITAPESLVRRLSAKYRLSFRFIRYAQLRNWEESYERPVSGYIMELRELGFHINFTQYPEDQHGLSVDPAVKRFFHDRDH